MQTVYTLIRCRVLQRLISVYTVCQCFNPFMPNRLFYLNSLDRSILYISGVWLVSIVIFVLKTLLNLMQTVYTLIRRRVLRRLIWVYTVFKCPIYGTLGLNELIKCSLTGSVFKAFYFKIYLLFEGLFIFFDSWHCQVVRSTDELFLRRLHCAPSEYICCAIKKIRLYIFDPLEPHYYIVKTGVYRGIHYFSYFFVGTP